MTTLVVPPTGLASLERALIDVVRGLLGRPFTSTLPSGSRLDKAAYHLLLRLEEFGDQRLSDLAAVAGLDVSTVSRQIRLLEDAELVSRRPDPDDKRANRLDLTDLGHRDLAAMRQERQARLEAATSGWSDHERATLTALLQRLSDELAPECSRPTNRFHREVASA